MVFLEIAGYTLLEVNGFAHVKHSVMLVKIAVNARQRGQTGYFSQQVFLKFQIGLVRWEVRGG
jgi:hypothetical protein